MQSRPDPVFHPATMGHSYFDRTDWWTYIASVPAPRFVVIEDADDRRGTGAFVGEVHAIALCRPANFSLDTLRSIVKGLE